MLVRLWRKENPFALLVGMQIGAATVESSMELPQKMELTYDPAISNLELYMKKAETLIQNDIYTFMFIAVLFTIAKIWKWSNCPSVNE